MNNFQHCKHENLEVTDIKSCLDCKGEWELDGELISKYPGCDCKGCPFKDAPFVPPDGPDGSELLFVGMAPAYYEVKQGRPFAGPSGQIFDASLDFVGLSRSDVRADNGALCSGIKPRQGDPPDAVLRSCRQHILNAMESAKIVVPMGNFAFRSTTGRPEPFGIMEFAGTTIRHENKIVMPLIHPSFYLEKPSDWFKDFLDSMELLASLSKGAPLLRDIEITTKVFTDREEVIDWLNSLEDKEVMAVDLETDYPDPVRGIITCISLAYNEHEAFVIPWDSEYLEQHSSDYVPLMEDQEVYNALKSCLERQTGLIAHNAPFDARLLRREDIDLVIKDDTLLMHYALDERASGQGLKRICKLMLGIPDWDRNLKQYLKRKDAPYTDIPPHALFPYAGEDGCRTVTLHRVLEELLNRPENEGPKRAYDTILKRMNTMLIDISLEGVGMDGEALVEALRTMPKILWELEKELTYLTDNNLFNPASPQQVSKFLFEKLKLPQVKGNSTDASVLEYLAGDLEDENLDELPIERQFPAKLLQFRHYGKVTNTYMQTFAREYLRGKGYPDLRLFGTVGGRLSGNKFNPLVFPRESRGGIYKVVKSIIVPDDRENEAIWVVDCKGMELRILAYLADDPWLKQQMNDRGVDFHSIMAQEIFGDRFTNADAEERKELRVVAKMLVFGLNYGRGAASIARQLGCSVKEAQGLIDRYFAPMPRVYEWREEIKHKAIQDEYLETPFGRRRRFHLITEKNKSEIERQALNIPVSSTANDVNFFVMMELRDRMHPVVKPKFPVHDSIVQSNRLDMTADQVREVMDIFTNVPQEVLNCTDLEFHWDYSIGPNWSDTTGCKSVEDIMNRMAQLSELSLVTS